MYLLIFAFTNTNIVLVCSTIESCFITKNLVKLAWESQLTVIKLAWESQLIDVAFKLIKLAWESQLTVILFKLIIIIILLRLNF